MENEVLGQILSELKTLNVRQNHMAEELVAFQEFSMEKLEKLERRFDGLEGRFDRLETRFDGLETRFDGLETRFDGLETRFNGLENEQKKTNLLIEHEIRPAIQLLAEGHMQMKEQLDRIEARVAVHDEVIFRRVK